MSEQLYKKVTRPGGTVRYIPVETPTPPPVLPEEPVEMYNLTDGEALTAAGSLGITLLQLFKRHIPPHKVVSKKIDAVTRAIFDLYNGTGEPIIPELADHFLRCWDKAMAIVSTEPVEVPDIICQKCNQFDPLPTCPNPPLRGQAVNCMTFTPR